MNSLRVCQSLPASVSAHVKHIASQSIKAHGHFNLAISGGSLPKNLLPIIEDPDVELDKWRVFFVDERYVALNHEDSNFKGAEAFLKHFSNVFPINPTLSLDECAAAYEAVIRQHGKLHLVLLGMGEDGHTASLFPGHALLNEKTRWISPISDSPKPPPQRVTMTLPLIADSDHIAFVAGGAGKQEPLNWIFKEKRLDIPSGKVLELRPDTLFFVDLVAGEKL